MGLRSRVWLCRWTGGYIVLFSLAFITASWVVMSPQNSDGPLGFGAALFLLLLVTGAINLGVGLVLMAISWLPHSASGPGRRASPRRHALYGALVAVPVYGLTTVLSFVLGAIVFENGLIGWYSSQMPKIQLGDSRQRVERILGQPGWHADCTSPYADGYSHVTDLSRCQSLSLYYQQQGSRQWEIAYDAKDRVVSKQYFQRQR